MKNIILRPRKEGQKKKEIYRQPELSFKEAQRSPLQVNLIKLSLFLTYSLTHQATHEYGPTL